MIIATGIDLIEISRIGDVFERRGERFRQRVYTDAEIEYCERQQPGLESYAARFAAKEAAMKALGTGWADGVRWRDIEVVRGPEGAPRLELRGRALDRFRELGASRAHLSLTHTRDLAMAQVIFES
ncbi:MAG TPA: holo-ACP synthase [Blastocatellia bacterium]|jgi:holo-[acyl-carrier protein] synthase